MSTEDALKEILSNIGEDPSRDGLLETPSRVAKMYSEIFSGYKEDPDKVISKDFELGHNEMVVVKDIPFYSLCEHHMVPFFGNVHVGYIPNKKTGRVVGLSKFARLVEAFARRLQVQERLTSQIADTIDRVLAPDAVGVIIEARHMCIEMRGIKKIGSNTTTSALRGKFIDEPETRAEFLNFVRAK